MAATDSNVLEQIRRAVTALDPTKPDGLWGVRTVLTSPGGTLSQIDPVSGGVTVWNARAVQGESSSFGRIFTGAPWSYTQLSGSTVSAAIGAAGNRIFHSIYVDVTTAGSQSSGVLYDNTASGGNILWQGNFASLGAFNLTPRDALAQNGLYLAITGTMANLIGGILWL